MDPIEGLYDTQATIFPIKTDSPPPNALLLPVRTNFSEFMDIKNLKNAVKPTQKRGHSGSQVQIMTTRFEGSQAPIEILDKNKQYKLYDGKKIALLSNCADRVLPGYLGEDPRRNPSNPNDITRACSTPQLKGKWIVRDYTLGILYLTPLVGKDTNGKYHPIDELDMKREYNILKQSLTEAAQCVVRAPSGSSSL